MPLKIALLLGLIVGILGVNTPAKFKIYIVSSEFIKQDEMETIRKDLQIKEFVSLPIRSYRVKPEEQKDFEDQLTQYTKFFKTTSDDKKDIIYEIFVKPTIPGITAKEIKLKSFSQANYYSLPVEPEVQLAFEKILHDKGVPFRSTDELFVSVPESDSVSFEDFMKRLKITSKLD